MAISENDLEILETYLDGELPIADAEGLWRRCHAEPAMAAALDELRAQRAVRVAVWESMEPREEEERVVCQRLGSYVRRNRVRDSVWRIGRWAGAAAAMILIGFGVGRVHFNSPTMSAGGAGSVGNGVNVAMTGNGTPTIGNVYQVGYFDKNGKLIAVQPFHSLQDASEFVNDVNNFQIRNHTAAASDTPEGSVVPVSDNEWR